MPRLARLFRAAIALGGLSALAATPAVSGPLSAEIAASGLAATEARLAALTSPADDDRLALGGVRFLRGIEGALQARWRIGLTEGMRMLPILRLPIDENPAPAPFDPASLAAIFRDLSDAMQGVDAPLRGIDDGSDVGLEIALADLWFDVNASGTREPGESVSEIAGAMILGGGAAPLPADLTIRLDAADAAWLSAYAHLLAGLSDMILAYDPTAPVARVLAARVAMADLGPLQPDPIMGSAFSDLDGVDLLAMIIATLDQTPDAARAQAAHDHFLTMIADNRTFWARVARETDNDREWLPNDAQTAAIGLTVPPGTGAAWLSVLSDAEALLQGRLLAPYWRVGGAGLNVGRMFTDPRPIDLAAWIQGEGALPYLERGPVIGPENWRAFSDLMQGQAMLMTVFLN